MSLFDEIGYALYNRRLYREGRANKQEIRYTTIGWRPDPVNTEDGYLQDRAITPSGEPEYYRVIRNSGGRSK